MKTGKSLVNFISLKFCFFFFILLTPYFSFGQSLGKYEFTGVSTQETQNNFSEVTLQPEYAVFSSFSRSVVQWWRGDNVYNSREWSKDSTDLRYIEFTVTAKPGHRLNLNKLTFTTSRTATGPAFARIAHNFSDNFVTDFKRYVTSETNHVLEWDFEDLITPVGGSVTFRLYGWGASSYLGAMRVDNVTLYGQTIPEIRVNEFHYANTAATQTAFVEVAFPKDFTQLNNINISLYNGEGNVYDSYSVSLFKTVDDGIFEEEKIMYLDVPVGLAEGKGGISISYGAHVIQFVSYGGAFTALSGPAAGLRSQDIIITETAEDGTSSSVYLTVGSETRFPAGIWNKGIYNSKGYPNTELYSVLPVELLFFRSEYNSKEVSLVWATASEKDNDKFVVERSRHDASNFEPIGTVKGGGTTHNQRQYKFIDSRPVPGTSYYRLKQIDLDGKVNYSPVVAVNRPLTEQVVRVFPNPTISLLTVDLGEIVQVKDMQLKIVNTTGGVVYQKVTTGSLSDKNLSVSVADLPAGTYYLVLLKDGKSESKPFIKL